jgi:hypothetical protein
MHMNKLTLSMSALMLTFGTAVSVPTAAAAQRADAPTIEEVCGMAIMNPATGFATVDECVEFVETSDAVEVCKMLKSRGALDTEVDGKTLNQGRCVSFIKHVQNDARRD